MNQPMAMNATPGKEVPLDPEPCKGVTFTRNVFSNYHYRSQLKLIYLRTPDGRHFFGYETFVFPTAMPNSDWEMHRKEYVVLYLFDKKGNHLATNPWYAGTTAVDLLPGATISFPEPWDGEYYT